MTQKKEPFYKKINLQTAIPLAILVFIVLFAAFLVIRLVIWDQGITVERPTEQIDLAEETEDYLVLYTPEELKQIYPSYKDDGILNVVVLGDESIMDFDDQSGIVQQISTSYPDANIYNICFPSSRIAPVYNPFSKEYPADVLNLYWLSVCIAGENYDLQTAFWDQLDTTDTMNASLNTLQSIHWNTVDILIFNYNAKEYLDGQAIESIDREDFSMYANAIYLSIEMLKEQFPYLQYVVASPTYCLIDQNGELVGSEITNSGYGFLPTYMVAAKNAATQTGVSYLDNILGAPINKDTYEDYLESDGITLNASGRKLIANRYISLLNY